MKTAAIVLTIVVLLAGCASGPRLSQISASAPVDQSKGYFFGFFGVLTGGDRLGKDGISLQLSRRSETGEWVEAALVPFIRLQDSAYMAKATNKGSEADRRNLNECLLVLPLEPGAYRLSNVQYLLNWKKKTVELPGGRGEAFTIKAGALYYADNWIGSYVKTDFGESLQLNQVRNEVTADTKLLLGKYPLFKGMTVNRLF